jgi:hypothetical protein
LHSSVYGDRDKELAMTEPIVFISHFQVKEGTVDGLRQLARDVVRQLEAEKPRTLVFLNYLSADGTQATFVHVFADAESMDRHFEGAEQRSKVAYEFLKADGWEIFGRPNEPVVEMMRRAATSSEVTLSVQPEYFAGFLRLQSG